MGAVSTVNTQGVGSTAQPHIRVLVVHLPMRQMSHGDSFYSAAAHPPSRSPAHPLTRSPARPPAKKELATRPGAGQKKAPLSRGFETYYLL